ncbi:DUF808 domain-containing protein [Corynebacterium epidermidicanis]|uniref:ABC transporter n=1 Tax=Corynebacterium epidermidicanis TaxID=1050174 RepID=A0A0G3GNR0_9CORY|nr:DUF808 domain-containing protein [Corynebacterium epidermidicanis]AKK02784.1 hypothetical protein CEPID_04565 [Corynebacterium epidermidicanis]
MPGGLAALLDDVAAIAKVAAANMDDVAAAAGRTSAKAAGVVVDDAAVTPRYVQGVTPARELPIIWRITKGSLVNKIIIILPLALALSQWAPWALTPLLMLGGTYLCFEGAEKVIEKLSGHGEDDSPAASEGEQSEDKLVRGAVTTDFILSAEIMVISLNQVTDLALPMRAAVLFAVAIAITLGVYGFVGLLVKMDDIGLRMAGRKNSASQNFGKALVNAMPKVLSAIAIIGTFAMLWVGGHIMLVGFDSLGWHAPLAIEHHLVHLVEGAGSFISWLVETICSLIFGAIWGAIIAGVVMLLPLPKKH